MVITFAVDTANLDTDKVGWLIKSMPHRHPDFESVLINNCCQAWFKVLLAYADKHFPGRWSEFEAKALLSKVNCLFTPASLIQYMGSRFDGLRWPEFEEKMDSAWRTDKDWPELVKAYKGLVKWENPKCDFEIPAFLIEDVRQVFKVTRTKSWCTKTHQDESMYVRALNDDEARQIAEKIGDDDHDYYWEIDGDEYDGDEYDEDPEVVKTSAKLITDTSKINHLIQEYEDEDE